MDPRQIPQAIKDAAAKLQTVRTSTGSLMPIGGNSEIRCAWYAMQRQHSGNAIVAAQRAKKTPQSDAQQRLSFWQKKTEEYEMSRMSTREALLYSKRQEAARDVVAEQTHAQRMSSLEVVNALAAIENAVSMIPEGEYKLRLAGIEAAIRLDPENVEAYKEQAGHVLDALRAAVESQARSAINEAESARMKAEADRAAAEASLARQEVLSLQVNGLLSGVLSPDAGDSTEVQS